MIAKPDLSNEIITIQQAATFYKITSINNHNFNPLEGNFRTFKIQFAKELDPSWEEYPLPVKAIIYAVSYENSLNDFDFMNHQVMTLSFCIHHIQKYYKFKLNSFS